MSTVVEEYRLILTDLGVNSNKFWNGIRREDNSVTTEWGRVGEAGASKTTPFGDPDRAEKYLASKRKEKEKKGYSLQRTISAGKPIVQKVNAATLIETSDETRSLIDYLVKVNIHQITSATNIQFDIASGSFQTPLGIVTADGIEEAESLLLKMGSFVERKQWEDAQFASLLNGYMRIVPTDIGRVRINPRYLYPDVVAIQKQQQILDSLKASLQALETRVEEPGEEAPSYRAHVKLVPYDGPEGAGTAIFKRINNMYLGSKNAKHVSATLKLVKVYEIELKVMVAAYANDGAKLSNVMELWHGTRAANLLSIMNSGYVIPRSGGSIQTTGRMYGDGVYFSDQSTKSLNYAVGYWGGGRSDKTFMLMNDVAMGNPYFPRSSFSGGCKPGYDSTFAKAGQSGVYNNEMIVYRTSQIKPKYLCEFGS